jgi:hypothetical protein
MKEQTDHGSRMSDVTRGKENYMNWKRAGLLAAAMVIVLAVLGWTQAQVQAAPPEKTLKVKLNYTGTGPVDQKHRIYVLVFDADPFTAEVLAEASAKPAAKTETPAAGKERKTANVLARQGATGKDQTLVFNGLTAPTVYAVAFYDKNGDYDGRKDPGSGSPMGVCGAPGKPEPIPLQAGATIKITLGFDDSTKTP